ncbi:twin-arginine translocase TatA/TatE family subunit [Isosphaeraceae bacterium EP7]
MFPQLGLPEMLVVMGVAVMLFGKRLPEVGRSLGKGIVEFKKGLSGIEEEFHAASNGMSSTPARRDDYDFDSSRKSSPVAEVPKFEAPSAPPVPKMEYEPQVYPD